MVEFNDKLPKWEAEGVEPPKTKQEEGWDIGDRPPAEWFNWLQNRTYKSLEELQEVAIQLGIDIENIDVTEELDALAEELRKEIALRVIKEEGKGLSTNDYTNQDKALVKTVKDKAEKIHTHSANDITETTTKKFVTSSEKSEIARVKDKADKTYVDEQDESLMKEIDSVKLSGVESNKILVDALNSKEVQASISDTIKTNVNKVNDIQTGSKVPLVPTNDLYLENGGTNKAIKLKWSSPKNIVVNGITVTEFKEDVLVRSATRIPTSIDDGIRVGTFTRDKHKVTPFIDRDVEYDKIYYYTVFSISTNKLISKNGYGEKIVKEGILISELPIGAKIRHSGMKYNDKPITFMKVANDGHYESGATIFITEDLICKKAFDAKEPKNSNSTRKSDGNNNYELSNIDLWLNSTSKNWYSARHEADQAPTINYVSVNPYADEAGFLSNFTDEIIGNIREITIKSAKHSIDGGGVTNLKRKIFLMSLTEAGLGNELADMPEGKPFPYFTSDEKRKASSYYWLRTPSTFYESRVRFVNLKGGNHWYESFAGYYGVRPVLGLNSLLAVKETPNPDGTYELTL